MRGSDGPPANTDPIVHAHPSAFVFSFLSFLLSCNSPGHPFGARLTILGRGQCKCISGNIFLHSCFVHFIWPYFSTFSRSVGVIFILTFSSL